MLFNNNKKNWGEKCRKKVKKEKVFLFRVLLVLMFSKVVPVVEHQVALITHEHFYHHGADSGVL